MANLISRDGEAVLLSLNGPDVRSIFKRVQYDRYTIPISVAAIPFFVESPPTVDRDEVRIVTHTTKFSRHIWSTIDHAIFVGEFYGFRYNCIFLKSRQRRENAKVDGFLVRDHLGKMDR